MTRAITEKANEIETRAIKLGDLVGQHYHNQTCEEGFNEIVADAKAIRQEILDYVMELF